MSSIYRINESTWIFHWTVPNQKGRGKPSTIPHCALTEQKCKPEQKFETFFYLFWCILAANILAIGYLWLKFMPERFWGIVRSNTWECFFGMSNYKIDYKVFIKFIIHFKRIWPLHHRKKRYLVIQRTIDVI